MLLISDNDVVEVKIYFTRNGNSMVFHEKDSAPAEALNETFIFRQPTWVDIKNINSTAVIVDPSSGKPSMDLFRYMDLKIKTLLKEWSLKNDAGEKLQVSASNINKLSPDLVQHLFTKFEEMLTGPQATPVK